MSAKYALIIGNTEYTDSGLAQLIAPGKDAEDFARVLQDKNICSFDQVHILLNQVSSTVIEAIDEFFDQKKPDDLLVLYFSGHGVRDELGSLYLAVRNTIRTRLRSTAIKSDYIREVMDQSRSKRQVLIMDCCNSGAFAQGTKAATGVSIGTATAFEAGYGRIILTASDSTQFAWEGDRVIGETDNSLFTHFLVEGLGGEADLDGNGRITVDELYDYAYEKVKFVTPKQTPSKFSSKQQGEIVLRQITRIEDIKPISLPDELMEATEDSRMFVREGAVQQLEKLLKGKNLGLARSAREVLERMEREDDSRRVSQAATYILEPIRQAEQKAEEERKTREETERLAILKAGEERLAREKVEADRKAKEQAEEERIRKAKLEAERVDNEKRIAEKKAEEERKARDESEQFARQKAEQERKARENAERDARLKATLDEIDRRAAERTAREKAEREATEKKAQVRFEIPKKSIWKIEPRPVIYGVIGAVVYGLLSWLNTIFPLPAAGNLFFFPAVAVLIFLGVAFGPIVGFIAGLLGTMIGDGLAGWGFYWNWSLGYGLIGMVSGLIMDSITDFRSRSAILKAIGWGLMGIGVGMLFASLTEMFTGGIDIGTALVGYFIPAFLGNSIVAVILLPILMIAFAKVISRQKD